MTANEFSGQIETGNGISSREILFRMHVYITNLGTVILGTRLTGLYALFKQRSLCSAHSRFAVWRKGAQVRRRIQCLEYRLFKGGTVGEIEHQFYVTWSRP